MKTKIIVTRRSNDYHACVEGTNFWGCGKTISEAVGDLIIIHREVFDIEITEG